MTRAQPAIAVYEPAAGIERSAQPKKRRDAIAELLRLLRIPPLDESAARAAAQIHGALIAATALAHPVAPVTHNERELGRVRGLAVAA